jgi:iron complex outermembrane receptor protein
VSENNFVPRVTLDYMLTEDAMIYTSAAKGIKPPTYITNDFSDPLLARVGSETLWTYEVGTKTQWADGRVTLNGAFFYNDYKDQQQRVQFPGLPLGSGANPRAGVVNAANVNVYGVEIDASWAPTDNLFFSASYAYTDGEYDDFVLEEVQNQSGAVLGDDDFASVSISSQAKSGSKNGDFTGNDTPGNPDHALSLLGKYQRTLTGDTDWYTQATATYQGERWADIANLVELEDYWLVNAQVGLEAERWNVAVYAENLLDDDTIQFAQEFIDFQQGFQLDTFSFPVAYWAYLPQPRTVGIRFQYRTP